jgi:hypothetical protein
MRVYKTYNEALRDSLEVTKMRAKNHQCTFAEMVLLELLLHFRLHNGIAKIDPTHLKEEGKIEPTAPEFWEDQKGE